MSKFDIVVIGSGSGLMIVEAAINRGLNCAIIENSSFGGTCLNKGCIPSKMLVYPADLIREFEKANRIGVNFTKPNIDWGKISERVWNQINHNKDIEETFSKIENLKVYKGLAEFIDNYTCKVKYKDDTFSENIQADIYVIATGARSFIPPIKNIEQIGYLTSESFFGEKFPKKIFDSLIIVGGGAIGAEFAHIFSSLGTKVTIVEMKNNILSTEEDEISCFVEGEFKNNGIDILTNNRIVNSSKNNNKKTLTVENVLTGDTNIIEAEEIFIASGVRTTTDILKLENTDIDLDDRGWIKTNAYLETSQKNIYAIGDVNGKYQFRHKANYEAEILMNNLFTSEEKKRTCYKAVPWAVFTWPQVAHVGMTEKEIQKLGQKYWIGRNYYSQIAAGISMGISDESNDNGFVKIIVGEQKTILGVHIVGPNAAVLVQPFVYLMNINYKCEKQKMENKNNLICPQLGSYTPIKDSMVIHPSFNELTAWVIDNINWQDVK